MQAIVTPQKHLRLMAAIMIACFLVVAGLIMMRPAHAEGTESADAHIITVHDDGTDKGFITNASTVREALKDGGIRLDARDRTEPGLDEKLVAHSYQINVYRARPVLIRDGNKEMTIITSYRTGRQIAVDAKITLQAEDLVVLSASTDPIADGAAEVMTISRATPFTFVFYGKIEQSFTQAKTVRDMLKEKGIKMTQDDEVQPAISTPISDGMTIKLWRNGVQTVTQEEDVAFKTEQVKDANRERGYKEIKTQGAVGKRTVTYRITVQNGAEVSREELNSVTTKEPITQIEIVGTKGLYTTPSENESITWDFLIGKGLTREQTAGVMGNLMQEHKFNTSGDGLAQWTGSRKAALMAMPYPETIDTQLNFLWTELNGGYAKALAAIRASATVEESVVAFQNLYERCGYCREDLRITYAYDILASH